MKYLLTLLCAVSLALLAPTALAEVPDTFTPRQFPGAVERVAFDSELGYTVHYDSERIAVEALEIDGETADRFRPIDETIEETSLTIGRVEDAAATSGDTMAALKAALEAAGYTVIPMEPGTLFDEAFEAVGLSGVQGDHAAEAFILTTPEGIYTLTLRYPMEGAEDYGQRLYGIAESFALTAEVEVAL